MRQEAGKAGPHPGGSGIVIPDASQNGVTKPLRRRVWLSSLSKQQEEWQLHSLPWQKMGRPILGRGSRTGEPKSTWDDDQSTARTRSPVPTEPPRHRHLPVWQKPGRALSPELRAQRTDLRYSSQTGADNLGPPESQGKPRTRKVGRDPEGRDSSVRKSKQNFQEETLTVKWRPYFFF